MTLAIQVVTREGLSLQEDGLERIVVRRREESHVPGSEIAICPHHGPLLMQTQACRMRMMANGQTRVVDVGAGVLEVLGDQVTLVAT
jgi:F0F1-type ATP synthase epsilon subunit